MFNLGMRYPTATAVVATVAAVVTLNTPIQVADNTEIENLPVLTKTIAG